MYNSVYFHWYFQKRRIHTDWLWQHTYNFTYGISMRLLSLGYIRRYDRRLSMSSYGMVEYKKVQRWKLQDYTQLNSYMIKIPFQLKCVYLKKKIIIIMVNHFVSALLYTFIVQWCLINTICDHFVHYKYFNHVFKLVLV